MTGLAGTLPHQLPSAFIRTVRVFGLFRGLLTPCLACAAFLLCFIPCPSSLPPPHHPPTHAHIHAHTCVRPRSLSLSLSLHAIAWRCHARWSALRTGPPIPRAMTVWKRAEPAGLVADVLLWCACGGYCWVWLSCMCLCDPRPSACAPSETWPLASVGRYGHTANTSRGDGNPRHGGAR